MNRFQSADGKSRGAVKKPIVAIGPLPPPRFGSALAFATMTDKLRKSGPVVVADTGSGGRPKNAIYMLAHASKVLRALGIPMSNAPKKPSLYHNVGTGLGLWYTILIVSAAGALAYRCFPHHHSCSSINRRMVRFAIFFKLSNGPGAKRNPPNTGSRPFRKRSPSTAWSISPSCAGVSSRDYQDLKQEIGFGHFEGRG